jgi:muramoyltetrapeptide carboxypeptidase
MVQQLCDLPDRDIAHLITLLTEARAPGTRPWKLVAHGQGSYRGSLVAANLTLASMLVGTPWPLPMRDAVIVLEEIGEKPYELDRYLTQLMLTGALRNSAAFVIGELTRCEERAPTSDPPDAALRVVLERLGALGKPVASGAPVGHGVVNEAVPFGAACELDLDAGTLAILEPAVQ